MRRGRRPAIVSPCPPRRRRRPAPAGRGYAGSTTFRALVDALERSDLIVHIERRADAGPGRGSMHFVAGVERNRYVRITLHGSAPMDAVVALLGHELQHAAEVADATWVSDAAGCARVYETIGYASCE